MIANHARRAGLARDLLDHANDLGLQLGEDADVLTVQETAALEGVRRLLWLTADDLRNGRPLPDVTALVRRIAMAPFSRLSSKDIAAAYDLGLALDHVPAAPECAEVEDHAVVATGATRA